MSQQGKASCRRVSRTHLVDATLIAMRLYQFSVKLHIIFTPPNLPLPRGGAAGDGVISMRLHNGWGAG
jgi:hypothetical protein